jgi:hypothetical protein
MLDFFHYENMYVTYFTYLRDTKVPQDLRFVGKKLKKVYKVIV